MEYSAIMVCPDVGVVRHEVTQLAANVQIGSFESIDDAIAQADQRCLDSD
jgi:hypothetical protein